MIEFLITFSLLPVLAFIIYLALLVSTCVSNNSYRTSMYRGFTTFGQGQNIEVGAISQTASIPIALIGFRMVNTVTPAINNQQFSLIILIKSLDDKAVI